MHAPNLVLHALHVPTYCAPCINNKLTLAKENVDACKTLPSIFTLR